MNTRQFFVAIAAIPVVVVAAMVWLKSQSGHHFSIEEKVNISALANRLCKAGAAKACSIEWGGKEKGHGTLARQGKVPVASPEQIRSVLAKPQWSETVTPRAHVFSNGKYTVSHDLGSGSITIASLE